MSVSELPAAEPVIRYLVEWELTEAQISALLFWVLDDVPAEDIEELPQDMFLYALLTNMLQGHGTFRQLAQRVIPEEDQWFKDRTDIVASKLFAEMSGPARHVA